MRREARGERREGRKRTHTFTNRAAALGCGAFLFWCALSSALAAGLFDDNEARKQIAAERQRIDEIRDELKTQQTQQQAADARMGRIEEGLKEALKEASNSQPLLNLFSQLEALKLEMNKLRGQLEVMNNNLENTAKRQRDMYLDLDTRLRRFEQQGTPAPASAPLTPAAPLAGAPPTSAPSTPSGASPPAPPAAPPVPAAAKPTVAGAASAALSAAPAAVAVVSVDNGAETRAYEAAQGQRRAGNYQGAIVAFQNFIKQYPKSNLAPRAQYWIGDSYFNLRDFKLAIASQQALISAYPDSPTVPDAMLNIATSQIEMGESNAGRKVLEELVAKFPISDAADKAKRRLAAFGMPASKTP